MFTEAVSPNVDALSCISKFSEFASLIFSLTIGGTRSEYKRDSTNMAATAIAANLKSGDSNNDLELRMGESTSGRSNTDAGKVLFDLVLLKSKSF
jgi:hypothetical protein